MPQDPLFTSLRTHVKCCACGGELTSSKFLNIVILNYQAEWDYPIAGNMLTGKSHQATAILCDKCMEQNAEILFAIEWVGTGTKEFRVIYHPVASLTKGA